VLLVDPPVWPGRGRLWSHLVSDVSYAELHAFAELLGVPRRGFDRDHYDVPADTYRLAVWLGARPVSSRVLLHHLVTAGLRRPKRPPRTGGNKDLGNASRPPGTGVPRSYDLEG
jgi:hypothetical protein